MKVYGLNVKRQIPEEACGFFLFVVSVTRTAMKSIWSPTQFEKVKVKVKFTLEQATKAQSGSRGIALLFP